jgi:hypothetical protein
MNFLKKGPEIKLPKKMPELKKPNVKVPGFASDLYHELSDRHLLPLVVVLLVAIVAVPVALSESAETPAAPTAPVESGATASSTTQVVVAKSAPGLRDYRKRLADLRSKDPFKPHYTPEGEGEGEGGGGAPPSTTTEGTDPEFSGEGTGGSSPSAPSTPSAPTETTADNPGIVFYGFAIDVRVVPVSVKGRPSKAKPQVRRDLPELTMLPSRQEPALVFMGVTKDTDKALMLVSSNVKGLFGDNICAVGGEKCELLAMEKGVPETVVYGGNEKVYRIELLDLDLVRTDELNKAPLGKPKKGKQGGGGGSS